MDRSKTNSVDEVDDEDMIRWINNWLLKDEDSENGDNNSDNQAENDDIWTSNMSQWLDNVDLEHVQNSGHLKQFVDKIISNKETFIREAFSNRGSLSIQKIIGKLEKTEYACVVPQILSTQFFTIMTHSTAWRVIKECIRLLGNQVNRALYENAIFHFGSLATHEVGCRSLNYCISRIRGELRTTLLNNIAYVADYLSNHPYGNYVVQHVLELRNGPITAKILSCLGGQIVKLSLTKFGSHVVKKCMKCSVNGLELVVREILSSGAVFRLAEDEFGNYVVQRALAIAKERGFINLYESLVMALRPYLRYLSRTKGGKNLINQLNN